MPLTALRKLVGTALAWLLVGWTTVGLTCLAMEPLAVVLYKLMGGASPSEARFEPKPEQVFAPSPYGRL